MSDCVRVKWYQSGAFTTHSLRRLAQPITREPSFTSHLFPTSARQIMNLLLPSVSFAISQSLTFSLLSPRLLWHRDQRQNVSTWTGFRQHQRRSSNTQPANSRISLPEMLRYSHTSGQADGKGQVLEKLQEMSPYEESVTAETEGCCIFSFLWHGGSKTIE